MTEKTGVCSYRVKQLLSVIAIVLILPLIILPVYAAETQINLDEIIKEAKKDNPEILEAKKKWLAAKTRVGQAWALPDPQFELMWENIPRDSLLLGDAGMRMYSISQSIPFPGKIYLKGRIASKSAGMAYEQYAAKELEVTSKVKKAYHFLSYIYKSIETNLRNKELINKFAKIAEIKYTVGKAPQHDVLKAQVEVSFLADELITLEQEKETAEATLNTLLNRPTRSPLGEPEEWEPARFDLKVDKLEKIALENRPELKRMEYAVKRSKSMFTLAGMQYLPDFKATYRRSEVPGTGWNDWDAMLMVSFPLWAWKQAYGIGEKAALKKQVEASYESMRNLVLLQVQDISVKVDSSWRRVNLFKTSILPQSEQAMKAASIAYETEKVDFLTLIRSQKQYQDAELKYYKALMKYGQNLSELERVIGKYLE